MQGWRYVVDGSLPFRRKTFMKGKRIAAVVLAAVLGLAYSAGASAYNFAVFNETSANKPFSLTNNVTSASLGYSSATPVSFDFTAPTGLSTADRLATLTITTNASATPATTSGGLISEAISPAVTFTFTENSTGKNLLTATISGLLEGTANGPSASLTGAASLGDTVTFTSDYLTFNTPGGNSAAMSLSGVNPALSIGAGGFLNSFVADLSGSFVASAVPEPGTIALVLCAGLLTIRRRGEC
jgi:hypothetical protein